MGKSNKKQNKQKGAAKVILSDHEKEHLYVQIRNAIRNKEFEQAEKLFAQYDPQDDISLSNVRRCVFSLPQMTNLVSPEDYLQTFSALNIDLTNPNHLKILTETITETEKEIVNTRTMAAQATTSLEKASATTAVQQAELACMLSKIGICTVLHQLIDDKKFSALKQLFKLTKSDGAQNLLQMEALKSIPADFNPKLTDNLIKSVGIDLATFMAVPPIELSGRVEESLYEASYYISQFLYNAWQHAPQNAQKLLNWFAHKGLNLNAKTIDNNVLLRTMFDQNSSLDFLAFIEFLVSSGKIDLNAVASDLEGNHVTPLSTAIGLSNLGLYKIILEHLTHGPRVTRDSNAQNVKIIIPNLGVEKLTMADRKIFLREIDAITTEFLSARLEKSLKEAEEKARAAEDALTPNEPEPVTLPEDKDSELSDSHLPPREEERAAEEKDKTEDQTSQVNTTERVEANSTEEIINELATLKEGLSKSEWLPAEECEQYELEALFLRYIQTKDKSTKKQITKLIAKNPNQEAYQEYDKILSDIASAEDSAETTFSTSAATKNYYELVHALHQAKKSLASRTETAAEEPMDVIVTTQQLAPGIYQVPGKKIFLKLSDDVKASLDTGECKSFGHKVFTQLEDPKFIAAKSLGLSGIKNYGKNIFKLKIAKVDANLVSTKSYIDESGNLLIEFDQILRHKEIDRLTTDGERVELDDIGHMIFAPMVMEVREEDRVEAEFSLHAAPENKDAILLTGDGSDDSVE